MDALAQLLDRYFGAGNVPVKAAIVVLLAVALVDVGLVIYRDWRRYHP